MERDPLRLAWTTRPFRHCLGFLLLMLAGFLLALELDLIRTVVDRAVGGSWSAPAAFLRIAISPPAALWPEPVVLFPGLALAPEALAVASISGILALPALIALILVVLDWTVSSIGSGILARIRRKVLDAVLKASPSAPQDDLTLLAKLASQGLSREDAVLGASLLIPVKLGGMIGLAFAYVLVMDWHLGAVLAAALAIGSLMNVRRHALRFDAAMARQREGDASEAVLAELEHRIPALRAHGTGFYERERIDRALLQGHRSVESRERRLAFVEPVAAAILMLAPLFVLALGAWLSRENPITAGTVAACALAASLAAYGVREIAEWHRLGARSRALLADMARALSGLKLRERKSKTPLPESGALVAQGISAYDPSSGARVTGANLNLAFPSHVALVGDGDAGPRLLAALIGGQIYPSLGHLTYGGVDLTAVDPTERAKRIAFAGDTVLIEGTLRDNLLYGCLAPDHEHDGRLSEAVAVTGLDRLTHARGLSGILDPTREPRVAAALVEARRAVQAALAQEQLDHFVDPFEASRYNRYATVGENLLFGKPIGDTFREDQLSSHPYVRAVLEAHELTKPLARIGLSIATSMIEIFAEIPDGHPLFDRFSFFSASDRAYFQDLVERQAEQRRSPKAGRDQERLIGLALRYNESRHRLGLFDEAMEARILAARADFARMLPVSLRAAIEFYDAGRFCAAASVQDNLLFGRIASDQAGALDAVQGVIRRVLTNRGLDGEVSRIGLNLPLDPQGADLTLSEIAAVDLVRCLVRRPSILVVQRALDGLTGTAADTLVKNLRRALVGRGLILVMPDLPSAMDQPAFDAVIRFERGEPVLENRARYPEALSA